ncbi:MAG: DUF4270 domain-containing protein [Bacteroidales bacterium]|jgi:hypothetical protein|nr:DUF4270 domain-containing protein [Bacteroidales bacterium]
MYFIPIRHKTDIRRSVACAGAFLAFCWLTSCDRNSSLGNYLVESHTRTVKVDTFGVEMSVLAKDSIVTSNKGVIFVGEYDDPETGKSRAEGFVEFTRTSDYENNEYPRFDSVTLVLNPTGNYYGDTLAYPDIRIWRLNNPIEMDDDGMRYSTSTASRGNELSIQRRFKMKGPSQKEVEIRLPDVFGEELFDGIIKNRENMNTDNYLKTFPGLAITPASGNSCIYAYSITDSTCQIRIHYRISESGDLTDKVMTFKANPAKQFNHLETTLLPDLPVGSKTDPVPTSKTHNKGFILSGGSPLYTRLDFPRLDYLQTLGEIVVIENARLIVRPVHHSYETVPLPPELNLYEHNPVNDERGSALTQLTAGSTQPTTMTGNLNNAGKNKNNHEECYYDFTITDFIASQIGVSEYGKVALSIDIPTSEVSNAFRRLVFGDRNFFYKTEVQSKENQIMLEITYSIYNEY